MSQQEANADRPGCSVLIRIIFAVFSLYLLGDAFNRWGGFSYYASFTEFLPAFSLAFILWTIVSIFAAGLVWSLFRLLEVFCIFAGIKIRIEHLLICVLIFALFGALAWAAKKQLLPDVQTTVQIKLAVFLIVTGLAIFTAWLFRYRAKRCLIAISERITPLVWIFGIIFAVSVPVVAAGMFFGNQDKTVSQKAAGDLSGDKTRPNIVLVTFDALAARNMSAYGYHKETTPFISRWAESAALFNKIVASSNFTTPSVASLMTGKRVWTHQTYHIEGSKPLNGKVESLPAVLKNNGYFNIALVVNPFASANTLGMSGSFHAAPPASEFGDSASLFGWKFGTVDKLLYSAFGEKIRLHNWILKNDFIFSRVLNMISRNFNRTTVPPEKAFARFFDIIDNNSPEPFFAWIHLFPPHDPYLPPEPYKYSLNTSDKMRTYKEQEKLIEESYKYLFKYKRYPEKMQPSVDLMRDYYDEFIKYIDREFGKFVEEMDKRELSNTVLILSSDHGESFAHGYFTHGGPFLYEQVTHIPLIIKKPGQGRGVTIDALAEQIDIPATILDLSGIPVPSWMEGRSLVPLTNGEKLEPRPVFSMNMQENQSLDHEIVKGSIAVWEGKYKMIRYLDRDESLLFDIYSDPEEVNNLIGENTELERHFLDLIRDNLRRANKKIKNNASGP